MSAGGDGKADSLPDLTGHGNGNSHAVKGRRPCTEAICGTVALLRNVLVLTHVVAAVTVQVEQARVEAAA